MYDNLIEVRYTVVWGGAEDQTARDLQYFRYGTQNPSPLDEKGRGMELGITGYTVLCSRIL